jgi:hypothetical protein
VVRYGLKSTDWCLCGYLFDTKTDHGGLYPWSVYQSCQDYRREWCTPCLFDAWWLLFGDQPPILDVDVRSPDEVQRGIPPILTCGVVLALNHSKETGCHAALGKDRCPKIIKSVLVEAGIDPTWTVHMTRGMTTSKAVTWV